MSLRKIDNILLCLFVFVVIYISDDTLLFGTNQNETVVYSKYLFYTILNVCFFFQSLNERVRKKNFIIIVYICLLLLFVLMSSVYNSDYRNGTYLFLYTLITASFFVTRFSIIQFSQTYIRILYYFSLISLVTYVINLVYPSVFSIFPTISNVAGVQFKFLVFANIFDGFNFYRNLSVFREPGIYAFHLCISLAFQLLFKGAVVNRKVLLITVVALFTTLSTAGIMIFGFIILIYNLQNRNIRSFIYTSVVLVGVYVVFLTNPDLLNSIFSKFDSSSAEYVSSLSRTASFNIPIEIIKKHWLFGVGITSFVDLYLSESLKLYGVILSSDSAATNTLLNIFSVYGIVPFLLIIYAIYSFSKNIDKRLALLIFVMILLLLSAQELRYSLLFSVLVLYGVLNINKFQVK